MTWLTPLSLAAVAAAAAATLACSSGDPATTGAGGAAATSTTGASTSTGTAAGGSGSGAGGMEPVGPCTGQYYGGNETSGAVNKIGVVLRDLNDKPMPTVVAEICGIDQCVEGTSDTSGYTLVDGLGAMFKRAAFRYGDGRHYAQLAVPILEPMPSFHFLYSAKLPDVGATFAAGTDVTSNGVTITVPKGAAIKIDAVAYPNVDDQQFRALRMPVAKVAAATDVSLMLEVVYGVGPVGLRICPPAKVTIPNTAQWPAGAAVEFFVHGVDRKQRFAPFGGWAKASDGKVSADGTTVSTADTGGFPVLTVFGARVKP